MTSSRKQAYLLEWGEIKEITMPFIRIWLTKKRAIGSSIQNLSRNSAFQACIELNENQTCYDFNGTLQMTLFHVRNGAKRLWLTYTIYLEWEDVSAHVQVVRLNLFEKLFNEKLHADCTIVASNGAEKNCHECVLAANSDVFHTMLTVGLTKPQTRRIEYDDVGDEAFDNVLTYCYGQELSMERLLKEVAIELLIRKSDDWFTMINVLTLYFFSVNVDSFQ